MPVTTDLRVRYAETDQMGVVYYANFFIWFEIGRVECIRSLGLAYSSLEKDHGCILPVIESHCRYRAPARYDDRIAIETSPTLVRSSVVKFEYRVYRNASEQGEERKLLAEGYTVHVSCDANMRRINLPDDYAAGLRAILNRNDQAEVAT